MEKGKTYIGTSGWNYPHWRGRFYDTKDGEDGYLDFYKGVFDTVEINNSFYQLPGIDVIENWVDTVGEAFTFSVKASRYITHMKKLRRPEEALDMFFERVNYFGKTLGPILFQLPPRWNCNAERLAEFLKLLPDGQRCTFEFRDDSWYNDEVYRLLEQYNAAFCIYDMSGEVSPKKVTADFVYIRLHGPRYAYEGSYDNTQLSGWASAVSTWTSKGMDVYFYFDNDQAGYAPKNAQSLKQMLEKE